MLGKQQEIKGMILWELNQMKLTVVMKKQKNGG